MYRKSHIHTGCSGHNGKSVPTQPSNTIYNQNRTEMVRVRTGAHAHMLTMRCMCTTDDRRPSVFCTLQQMCLARYGPSHNGTKNYIRTKKLQTKIESKCARLERKNHLYVRRMRGWIVLYVRFSQRKRIIAKKANKTIYIHMRLL